MIYEGVAFYDLTNIYEGHYSLKIRIRHPLREDDIGLDLDLDAPSDSSSYVLKWCEKHFGPKAITFTGSRLSVDGYNVDTGKRWSVHWPVFYFKDIVDATHFKLRWA